MLTEFMKLNTDRQTDRQRFLLYYTDLSSAVVRNKLTLSVGGVAGILRQGWYLKSGVDENSITVQVPIIISFILSIFYDAIPIHTTNLPVFDSVHVDEADAVVVNKYSTTDHALRHKRFQTDNMLVSKTGTCVSRTDKVRMYNNETALVHHETSGNISTVHSDKQYKSVSLLKEKP